VKIEWRIDPGIGVVHLRYAGQPDFAYWAEVMRTIFAHPAYRPGMGFVAELDGALPPDTAHLMQVLAFVSAHEADFGACRWANVTTNPAHYGMTRVAQARSHHVPSTVGVFSTVAEAVAWARPDAAAESHETESPPD
jgi:hypothetical protein